MAGRLPNPSFWKTLTSRVYSAQTAVKSATSEVVQHVSLPKQSTKVSKLPNGGVVASVENYSPVSRIGVYFKAGSRYEPTDHPGLTHCLRTASCLSTKKTSSFGLVKNVEHVGANISCISNREYIGYSLVCKRDELHSVIRYLAESSTQPEFKPWEIESRSRQMKLDLALLDLQPEVRLLESLHKAAFKRGLANSIFAPSYMIGHYTPEDLYNYIKSNYLSTNMAIVGIGVDHDVLQKYAHELFRPSTSAPSSNNKNSKYIGGEVRVETRDPLTYVAMAAEGSGWKNTKETLALSILQQVMGTGSTVKRGSNTATSKLGKAGADAVDSPFYVSCINYAYEDTGIFGFYAVGQPKEINKLLGGIVQQYAGITKSGVTDQEVEQAKNRLKASLHMEYEDSNELLHDMGFQACSQGQVVSLDDVIKQIDAIKATDVSSIAKRVITSKPSLAILGNLSQAPYLDEMK